MDAKRALRRAGWRAGVRTVAQLVPAVVGRAARPVPCTFPCKGEGTWRLRGDDGGGQRDQFLGG